MALHILAGSSEQFETFLSHRGEEMGSIRGRVRIHVPKDRRGTRKKSYGGLAGTILVLLSALLALSLSAPLSLLSLTLLSLTLLPLFGFSMTRGLALHLLVSIDHFLFWLLTE